MITVVRFEKIQLLHNIYNVTIISNAIFLKLILNIYSSLQMSPIIHEENASLLFNIKRIITAVYKQLACE